MIGENPHHPIFRKVPLDMEQGHLREAEPEQHGVAKALGARHRERTVHLHFTSNVALDELERTKRARRDRPEADALVA